MICKISKYAGLCFGVSNAIKFINEHSRMFTNTYMLGCIANNRVLVDDITKKNIKIINNINNLPKNSTVIIRTHGVPENVINSLTSQGINIIDKTCPKVKLVHNIVKTAAANHENIIVIGYTEHPEVQGILGQVGDYKQILNIFNTKYCDKLAKILANKHKTCVVVQTTFDIQKFEVISEYLKQIAQNIIIYNTICSDVNNRRTEIICQAKKTNFIILVGSPTSSNSMRLYEAAGKFNNNILHIENPKYFNTNLLENQENIFITTSASSLLSSMNKILFKIQEFCEIRDINLQII